MLDVKWALLFPNYATLMRIKLSGTNTDMASIGFETKTASIKEAEVEIVA